MAKQTTQLHPLVLAALTAKQEASGVTLSQRVVDVTADTLTSATRGAGQIFAAFDLQNAKDGHKVQRVRNMVGRANYYEARLAGLGIDQESLAALIAG